MNPGSTQPPSSGTRAASSPIAPRTSAGRPTATIRPSRTPTASARGRAGSIVTTSPSRTNAPTSAPATCATLAADCAEQVGTEGRGEDPVQVVEVVVDVRAAYHREA